MPNRLLFLISILAVPVASTMADSFDRPVPQAQSATAEFWFGLASLALCVALYLVYWVVKRR